MSLTKTVIIKVLLPLTITFVMMSISPLMVACGCVSSETKTAKKVDDNIMEPRLMYTEHGENVLKQIGCIIAYAAVHVFICAVVELMDSLDKRDAVKKAAAQLGKPKKDGNRYYFQNRGDDNV